MDWRNLEDWPDDHKVTVAMANYLGSSERLMSLGALREHVELCGCDDEVAESNAQFGGYVIIDRFPLECRCKPCRGDRKAQLRILRREWREESRAWMLED